MLAVHMKGGLAQRELTRPQAQVLWQLAKHPPLTQRELSGVLQVSPRHVTWLVDQLEASGHVRRGAHPTDRRATLLTLTDRGSQVAEELRRDHQRLAEQLFAGIAERDAEGFLVTTEQVLSRMSQAQPDA